MADRTVKKVIVQIRGPKGNFPGEVAEGWYVVFENNVILTDQNGKPIPGVPKQHLTADGDARLIACRMVRNIRRSGTRVAGFHRQIVYPKLVY